jgi:hypothetical protein
MHPKAKTCRLNDKENHAIPAESTLPQRCDTRSGPLPRELNAFPSSQMLINLAVGFVVWFALVANASNKPRPNTP